MRVKILELLEERGLRKCQMSRDLDYSQQYVSQVINGKYDGGYKFWKKFQEVYDIPRNEIKDYMKVSKDNEK